jgi:hypothetical protein
MTFLVDTITLDCDTVAASAFIVGCQDARNTFTSWTGHATTSSAGQGSDGRSLEHWIILDWPCDNLAAAGEGVKPMISVCE